MALVLAFFLRGEMHELGFALAGDRQLDLTLAEPDHACAFAHHRLPRALARDPALALAAHVVEGGGIRRDNVQRLALGRDWMKAFGIFLGNERRRELARPPALVLHHRRQERNMWAEARQAARAS